MPGHTSCHACRTGGVLFDLLQAPIRWQLVQVGLELRLFDQIVSSATAGEIAAALSLNPRRTGLMLDALCGMGLVVKRDARYGLTEDSAAYLTSDGTRSMRDSLLQLAAFRHGGLTDLPQILRTADGETPAPVLSDPQFWDRSLASLRSFHRSLGTVAMLDILEALPEWPRARSLLDVGAGSDCLCLAIAERRPAMSLTLFDLPPCAEKIEEGLKRRGVGAPPIRVVAGDYNEGGFGEGYDVVWASMTLYYARDLRGVLTEIHRALAPGGVFVSLHEGLTGERTHPESHVIGRLIPALKGMDVSFDRGCIATTLLQTGFSHVESHAEETQFGPMEVDIARKAI